MHRDPPHYLKAVKTTTTPKRLLWLASRGRTVKQGDVYVSRFDAAALGKTHWTARKGERRDTIDTYSDPSELWADVAEWCPVNRRVVLFSYDLARELRMTQMLAHLPALGWGLDKIVLEKTAAWALLRCDGRSLMACDLRSWCPVEWHKLVSDVTGGYPHADGVTAGENYNGKKCVRTVEIVREAVLQITNWIEGENLGPFRPTGSGQSYAAYRRRFMRARLLVHDDANRLVTERTAMHTGRAEAWRHGRISGSRYCEFDLHAAYATIGAECDVPTIARGELAQPSVARLRKAMQRYAVLADVTVETDVECLPYNNNGRTVWPVGRFRTVVWDPEIQLALTHCRHVRVNHAWLYTREPALQTFCQYVLDGIDGQTQVYGLIPQRVMKHWSRCLVGRLGLRFRAWHKFGPCDPPDVRLVTYLDADSGERTDMLLAGTQILLLGEMAESTESLPQVPGWIMSECRRRLWNAMRAAGLYTNVLYVDTDSVIVNEPGADYLRGYAKATGQRWDLKAQFSRCTIHGPRNLEVDNERRVSGLPLGAKQTAPLEFTGEVMRSVKQSMRNGDFDAITSIPRKFVLTPHDLRRRHIPAGHTRPYKLEEQNV